MDQNDIDQESKRNNICWFCKSSMKTQLEDFHSHQIKEDVLLNSINLKELVQQEVLHFCQNTTIRAVPRIVKTTNRASRILWISFFIILCLGLTICLTFLIRQFRDYDVIHPPRILQNQLFPFPSFTLCNHRPLSHNVSSFLLQRNMRNPREFAINANNMANHNFFKKNDTATYSLLTPSFSLTGYLESIPLHYHKLLGHHINDFLIGCTVTFRNGSKHKGTTCWKLGMFKDTPHAQFINCVSYNINETYSEIVTTIEIYLYLYEETNNSRCLDCFISNVKSQLSGALLVIHKSKSFPNINQEAINLQPGTLTEVRLKTFYNVMKLPPYGNCALNTPQILEMGKEVYSYTAQLCKEKTIQSKINKQCNCNAIEYPILNPNISFCSSLPKFIHFNSCGPNSSEREKAECVNELISSAKRLECKSSVTVQYHKDVIDDCSFPCSFYSYESDRSISSWPTKSWQLTWLTSDLGKSIIHKSELKDYKIAAKLFVAGQEEKAMNILNTLNTLEKKLIAVIINKPNKNLHKVEEKEVLSLTSFLSQLGGLFSIFIGLTLISIVEFIELLIRVFEGIHAKLSNHKKLSLANVNKTEIIDNSCKNFYHYTSVTNL